MMRCAYVMAALFVFPALADAVDDEYLHDHHKLEAVSPRDPPIKLTINSEARVSVVMAGELPPPALCGTAVDVAVRILNRGFVTAPLEADWVGDAPPGATLEFRLEPLKGVSQELRTLKITLSHPGPLDLTIAFKAHHDLPDLGGRDRVHFLMSCK